MDATGLMNKLMSHAAAIGNLDFTIGHEPKSAPGKGLTAALWSQTIQPVATASGLAATTARIEFSLRIYQDMLMEPQDAIDPNIMAAVDKLITAYAGDFTLDGSIRNVDLLGAHGTPLQAIAGYIQQDQKMMRVMTITIPCIVNDAWPQAA